MAVADSSNSDPKLSNAVESALEQHSAQIQDDPESYEEAAPAEAGDTKVQGGESEEGAVRDNQKPAAKVSKEMEASAEEKVEGAEAKKGAEAVPSTSTGAERNCGDANKNSSSSSSSYLSSSVSSNSSSSGNSVSSGNSGSSGGGSEE